ncbi:S9 family peptidase [Chelatococcus sp. GCM10030263]|uniref:S9 family peptidase n=1 Tax=Chelatococcus sp. GCM10030263 TaxID=3273387 RepID=UPI00361C673F
MVEQPGSMGADIGAYIDIRTAKSPAVSPDGELLAYLSDESGTHQIWLKPTAGGAPWRLTDLPEPVGAIAFSPKSRDLLFTMDCGGDERHQLWLVPEASGLAVPLTEDPTTLHAWGCWSPDGTRIAFAANSRDKSQMDLFVMEVATRETTAVLQGVGYREAIAFFPDGRSLLVRDATRAMNDQDLFRLDLGTGALEPLLPHEGRAQYRALKTRKDGSGFFLVADHEHAFHALGFYALSEKRLTWLVERDNQDIEAVAVSPDQQRLTYVVNDEGWSRLFLRELETGENRELRGFPLGTIASVAFTPDNASVVFPLEGAATPGDIWRYDLAGEKPERLTKASKAGVDVSSFIEPTVERVGSFDGLQVPVFVYRPRAKAPAAGYPAVIIVHGGPEAQWTPGFRADVQYMLAQGIMVVAPNVRGSTGYGRPYQHLDDKERRMDSVADLKAVRLWLGGLSEVDESRIAVFGRSYGGFMVLAALTEYPELWKLGIEFYGIANFETLLETTGPWRKHLRAAKYGDPVADKDLLARISPIRKIDRIRVPLLMAQGLDDPRVPPGESEMIFSALRGLGRSVEYLRIPHEGHGFARIENRRTVFGAVADFLARHL